MLDEIFQMPRRRTTDGERKETVRIDGTIYSLRVDPEAKYAPSIPDAIRPIIPLTSAIWAASLYHDLLYQWKGLLKWAPMAVFRLDHGNWVRVEEVGRAFSDKVFEAVMEKHGEPAPKRLLIHYSVRALGYPVWVEGEIPPQI